MKKSNLKKLTLLISLVLLLIFAVAGCDNTSNRGESALQFTAGVKADAPKVTYASLSDYGIEVDEKYFSSIKASCFSDVAQEEVEDYIISYGEATGWTLINSEPIILSKNETVIIIGYDGDSSTLIIVTAVFKAGGVWTK